MEGIHVFFAGYVGGMFELGTKTREAESMWLSFLYSSITKFPVMLLPGYGFRRKD